MSLYASAKAVTSLACEEGLAHCSPLSLCHDSVGLLLRCTAVCLHAGVLIITWHAVSSVTPVQAGKTWCGSRRRVPEWVDLEQIRAAHR